MLELCDIELGFDAGALFSGLNLTIAPGEICLLTAPSGAGKSSLLRWMAGLETPGLRASDKSGWADIFFLICLLSSASLGCYFKPHNYFRI